jgi:RNA polymerase primary sigma factor
MVRLPSNRVHLGNKVQKAISLWEQVHERNPSSEELANEMKISEKDLQSVNNYHINYVSLDSPISITSEESMLDNMVDEDSDETDERVNYKQSLEIEINRCLKSLTEREKHILCAFFGIGLPEALSLNEIALKHNMSSERARQIKDKAVHHLRSEKKAGLLRKYL